MDDRLVVGWDTETHRIGPGKIFPPVVCLQTCMEDGEAEVICKCEDGFEDQVSELFNTDHDFIRVAQRATFDLGVMYSHRPDLLASMFEMLEDGRLVCTRIREKLLNLTSHGNLEFHTVGDTTTVIKYSLADLVMQYFGVDLKEGKATQKRDKDGNLIIEGDEDAWRLNYAVLEDMPVSEWPEEAVEYAASDAIWARAIYFAQERAREAIIKNAGHDPFETLHFRCAVDFVLGVMSARGVKTDPARVERVRDELKEELSADKMQLLIAEGILRPAEPPRPYKNGATNEDGSPKMTAGKKESVDTAKLKGFVEQLAKNDESIELARTAPSDKFPEGQISVSKEWLNDYAYKSKILLEYQHRQSLQKLVTTELPRMMWEGEVASVVHPNFDVLKATGRTSSYAGDLYPSFNCQNVDPRIRRGYIPRAGHLMFSIDYGAMELGTFAQTCINLLGHSHLAEIINRGIDPHAYLGAQIALATDEAFAEVARMELEDTSDKDAVYEMFSSLKEDPDLKKMYKHFRTFAKPTGLGYPGGLGPDTFIKFAKGTYRIEIDRDTAVMLREVWMQTFPEAPEYFEYVNKQCIDELNGSKTYTKQVFNDETGEWEEQTKTQDRYRYKSPMGMWRMACDYCACCNGMGLQTPSAEGALLGLYEVNKRCLTPGDPFHGKVFPLMFIHDEIVGEIAIDTPENMTRLLSDVAGVMVDSMEVITPDVKAKAEPVLMTRWDKFVDPAYDKDGYLMPVDPDRKDQ